jgi:hypothetical protein
MKNILNNFENNNNKIVLNKIYIKNINQLEN